jgi:hypothetical protein
MVVALGNSPISSSVSKPTRDARYSRGSRYRFIQAIVQLSEFKLRR